MLWVCSDITFIDNFRERFRSEHEGVFLDLSKTPSNQLADESDSIVSHHSKCSVFLGYLEPGWMLDPTHQTRLRKLFRKFPVGVVINFVESIPFSWKTEIDTLYVRKLHNGKSNSIDNGGSLQDES